MRHRDLFGVGVELLGVWLITRGVTYISAFIDMKLYPRNQQADDSATAYLIYVTLDFALAAFFLLWAPTIVSWSYGADHQKSSDRPIATKSGTASLATPDVGS